MCSFFHFKTITLVCSISRDSFLSRVPVPLIRRYHYRHNKFFMPEVKGIMTDLYRDFNADYYCLLNSDILLGPELLSILDYVDNQIQNGVFSSIVMSY